MYLGKHFASEIIHNGADIAREKQFCTIRETTEGVPMSCYGTVRGGEG